MSDLYSYQCRPFVESSSDDEDVKKRNVYALTSRSSKRKRPRVQKYKTPAGKSNTVHTIDDSDSDDLVCLNDDDDNGSGLTIGAIAANKAEEIIKNTVSSIEPMGDFVHIEANSKDMMTAQGILEHFRNHRKDLDRAYVQDVSIEDVPLTTGTTLTASIMASLPSVRRASERITQQDKSLEFLCKYSSLSESKQQSAEPRIKLKTVLNGSHEWRWRIAVTDTFFRMKQKFAEIYGLSDGRQITLKFDGDVLADEDTPQSADMEDDDQLDATINKDLLTSAIAAATMFKSRPLSNISGSGLEMAATQSLGSMPAAASSSVAGNSTTTTGHVAAEAASGPSDTSDTSIVRVLIPRELSVNGEDRVAQVRGGGTNSLAYLHQTLQQLILTQPESGGNVWYSLQTNEADEELGDVDELMFTDTITEIVSRKPTKKVGDSCASTSADSPVTATLLMHPPRTVLDIFVTRLSGNGERCIIKVKAKPSQRCAKMMSAVCGHFDVPLDTTTFTVNGRALQPSQTFKEGGVGHNSEILVSQLG